jgi:alpha-glucuronidase
VAQAYESLETCPDQFLLFMHHVPYTHVLKSGKTVAQHLYDAAYLGERDAAKAVEKWRRLAGHVDPTRYRSILALLDNQAAHAQVCRDALCSWLKRTSGVADSQGRVGKHPQRIEAEKMQLHGYEVIDIVPPEAASRGRAAACLEPAGEGTLRWRFKGKPGWFDINVFYYDENDGVSHFRLFVGDQVVDEWAADDALAGDEPGIHTATRQRTSRVALRPDDELCIEATADALERAVVDYVEVGPSDDK